MHNVKCYAWEGGSVLRFPGSLTLMLCASIRTSSTRKQLENKDPITSCCIILCNALCHVDAMSCSMKSKQYHNS